MGNAAQWAGTHRPEFADHITALAELVINGLTDADLHHRYDIGDGPSTHFTREKALVGYMQEVCGPALLKAMYTTFHGTNWDAHCNHYGEDAHKMAIETIADLIMGRVDDSVRD
jgi:hypothetical protein